ncbi:MAG: SDR family oxidoreductase [Balneolaceae bacterium]|nr:SDR family oxidoreductase [Balneolaceae bacterium]
MPKTAVVTGASRGIGYETSLELARREVEVIAVARTVADLKELASHFPDYITPFPADLTVPEAVKVLGEEVAERGTLDLLVNNAGTLANKPFDELSMKEWRHAMDVNLFAAVRLTRELLDHLGEGSHIVNISSMGGYQGSAKFPGLSAYSVAKGALAVLSECLASELSGRGIRCNALCLGAVQTEMLQEAFPGFEAPVDAGQMGRYVAEFGLEGANFYNGQILPVTLGDPG